MPVIWLIQRSRWLSSLLACSAVVRNITAPYNTVSRGGEHAY